MQCCCDCLQCDNEKECHRMNKSQKIEFSLMQSYTVVTRCESGYFTSSTFECEKCDDENHCRICVNNSSYC